MLGRYQVLKHLASGGMAEVLIARSTGIENFERHVVIKRIRAEQARDAKFVTMFIDEARLAAALHHNNIVQVHDIGQEAGEYFFTMDYIHGEDLRRLLTQLNAKSRRLPLEHVITIVTAVAAALHYAHDLRGTDRKPLGIVHRDISPANILVAYDGNVKVVDFGIAKATMRSAETRSGTLKGKIAYMAPEQCNGLPVDRRSDVFALGIVLYELATVRRLFKGENDFLTMSAIVAGNIPRPSQYRPDLPPGLEAIILKALALRPVDRYQTADEMRLALEQFANESGLRTSTTALADYMTNEFGRRPEPWLVDDDDEPEIQLDVDFDGSASGIAQPLEHRPSQVGKAPDAPIARARAKAITGAPQVNDSGWGAPGSAPTTASGTPMAWQAAHPSAPRRRRWWIIAAPTVVALGVVAIVATGALSTTEAPPVTTAPAARSPELVPQPAAPAKAEPPPVIAPEPPPSVAVVPAEPVPASPTTAIAKPSRPRVVAKPKPVVVKKPPRPGSWDPNALFPKHRAPGE